MSYLAINPLVPFFNQLNLFHYRYKNKTAKSKKGVLGQNDVAWKTYPESHI